jgi:large subunit ribosomal protein L29
MPNKKYDEVRNLTVEELEHQLAESKLRLQRLRFNHTITPLENPNVLGEARRYIARIQTEVRKRQLETNA